MAAIGDSPQAVAARRRPSLRISVRRLPPGVTKVRFLRVVRSSAKWWSIRVVGATRRPPGRADGHGVIGFSAKVSGGAAGMTTTWTTTIGRRILRREFDVGIDPGIAWNQGPAYPTFDQWDLESVIMHELGHVAGRDHSASCADSPMADGIANGEWWRRPGDWFRHGCANAPGQPIG